MAVGIIGFSVFYAWDITRAKKVSHQKNFYYLVREEENVEVSAEFAKLEGGAGYLLEEEEGQYVALSVYLNEEDAQAVLEGLQSEKAVRLLPKGIENLYFKGKDKRKSTLYVNALRTLEGYMSVLNECIARLEKGETQENCKRILQILERQFAYAQEEYEGYPAFATSCGEWSDTLREMGEETVYVKDLRYLLCGQVERYLQLCESFSI